MGHIVNPDKEYRLLQQRLDRMVTGAPDSPALMRILQMLFSPEDASLARHIPSRPTRFDKIAARIGMPAPELEAQLDGMARRGLVLDFYHRGNRYFLLAPVVIGFFEFTFMRTRDDLPMKDLAELFQQYMYENERFGHAVFGGETQIGRALVREETLPDDDHTEILDWERASFLITSATHIGVSLCACRHKAEHLGHACDAPVEACVTLNAGAETMTRNGLARPIATVEAMDLLARCKQAGLAQVGDNVQRDAGYICNCCGCCCGMMNAVRHLNIANAIVTSNWIMGINPEKCTGCGRCVKACPVAALSLEACASNNGGTMERKRAVCEETICLGCGVCVPACRFDAIRMHSRAQRVLTPASTYERVIRMAIERGKLADLLFDDPDALSYKTLGAVVRMLEKAPPVKALMAVKPLQSAFLNALLGR